MKKENIKFLDRQITVYKTKLNLLNLNNIYPHEETLKNNSINLDILQNSQIVLGLHFPFEGTSLEALDSLFILDGHHRYEFIKSNNIDEEFNVILVNIKEVVIFPYNCELLVGKKEFTNMIYDDYDFINYKELRTLRSSLPNQFIKIGEDKFLSKNIKGIKDLYRYKKLLIENNTISPIPNNLKSNQEIIKFSPLSYKDFEKNYLFPYKSTWIMPRFD